MIAVLTHVFLGRGEKRFEIKMFRNYFRWFGFVFVSPSLVSWTPHITTSPAESENPPLVTRASLVMGTKPGASRTGLVRIRDVEKFPRPMAIAQCCFLLPREVQENSSARAFFGLVSHGVGLWLGRVYVFLQQSVPTFPRTDRRRFS